MAYCVNCGVELAASEKVCPLCRTEVFHPDVKSGSGETLFPIGKKPYEKVNNQGIMFFLTILYLCPIAIVILCDLKISGGIGWSGIVTASMLLGYVMILLPIWFRKPNPVVFVPCDFAAIALFLFYLNNSMSGNWFLTLALPITVAVAIITTTVVTLVKHLKHGRLYIFGGAIIATGAFTILVELMVNITFHIEKMYFWSLISFAPLFLMGMCLITIAICKPLKESLKKKLFF